MSRVAKTLLNARVTIVFHLLFIFVQFFARKTFLDNLGDDFIGLTSTLRSFLGFLNLAELGIGTAIGFSLYKPIYDHNHERINSLIDYFGYLYKKIGFIILILALTLSAFFPLIFSDVSINLEIVYYSFYVFMINSLLGYFYNYHIFLLQADQKDYIVAKYVQTFTITKILIQIVVVFYYQSFFWWITLELLSTLSYSYALRRKVSKEYPWLVLSLHSKTDSIRKFPDLLRKIKQISVHKLGAFLNVGTDNIVIFSFVNVQSVAFFGNYQMIIDNLYQLIHRLFSGTNASVGNLVAERNESQIMKVFWELMALRFFVAAVSTICILLLIEPFIILWLGPKYILEQGTLIFFSMNFFITQIRQPVDVFIQAYGLYDDIWAPIVQSIVNIAVSITLVNIYGITGVLVGTFVGLMLIVMIWRPYHIFKKGFGRSIREYIRGFLKMVLSISIAYAIISFVTMNFIEMKVKNFLEWGSLAFKIIITTSSVTTIFLYLLNKGFRDLCSRIINLIRQKLG